MWHAVSLRLLMISLVFMSSASSCREPLSDPAAKPAYPVEEEVVVVVEPQRPPPSTGRLQVCGNLDVDKPDYTFSSAKLEDFPIDPSGMLQHLPGPYSMVLLDGAGQVLSEEKFGQMGGHAARIGPDGEVDCHPVMISFSCMYVPFVPGAERLQVRLEEAVLESFTRSRHAPELRVTSPVPHSGLPKKGKLKIAWEATDADGDILSHSIYYRSGPGDGGLGNWEAVIGDFAETSIELDALIFAPGPAPELMILTTDRFNTTRAVVELGRPHDTPRGG